MIHFVISTLLLTMNLINPYTIIEDQSDLPLLNPDLENRQTLKLNLANGLEVLLISDDQADESAAAVRVGSGSWSDPKEYPGMAHFCEHMLFMGTKKYPNENEFFSLVSNYAGQTNAFTAPNRTVYMFSCQTNGFLELLDHFAHFFIDPLFNPNNIAREMHAVDQEFAKNVEHDGWREYMVFKETGNQNHPNRAFSTGNSQTLSKIPQEVLHKWHKEHYGADKMHLVIYSPLPLNTLKDTVIETFSRVPQVAKKPLDTTGSLTSLKQLGSMIFITPIKDRQTLTLSWELPLDLSLDPTKSADLVAYTLRRGQKYSLYEKLKAEGLIDTMSIRVDELAGPEHKFFQISMELTNKGIEEYQAAITYAFEAIANIQQNGIPKYLFDEKNTMAQLNYQYQERGNPFRFITSLADSVANEPLSTYPRNSLLSTAYDPDLITKVTSILTPSTCLMSLMASPELTKVSPTKKEQWLGAEYEILPIDKNWADTWAKAEPNDQIRTPKQNPFIPENLNIVQSKGSIPALLSDNELGTAYYVRASEFNSPDSIYNIHILSPLIDNSPKSAVLTSLYIDHLTDLLHPTLAAAKAAGLSASFNFDRSAIQLEISGYSEKAPLLLQQIAKQMPKDPPTLEQFSIYMDRHLKSYANAQKDLAARQAKELANSIINPDQSTSFEKLQAIQTITYEEFLNFHQNLFASTYLQGVFSGNLTTKQAESAWLDLIHFLVKSPYDKSLHAQASVIQLSNINGPFMLTQKTQAAGNASLLLIDEGEFTFQKRAAQEVLNAVMKEAFFNELRTKQKTGYIAQSDAVEIEDRLFRFFLVQSNSHQPEELLFRFELFIEEFHDSLKDHLPLERFNTVKNSLTSSLQNRFRNLSIKSQLWDFLAFEKQADFSFVDQRIEALNNLSYEEFLEIADLFLSRKNRRRLAILFEGKLASPFAYQLTTLPEINEIANYAPKPLKKAEEILQ